MSEHLANLFFSNQNLQHYGSGHSDGDSGYEDHGIIQTSSARTIQNGIAVGNQSTHVIKTIKAKVSFPEKTASIQKEKITKSGPESFRLRTNGKHSETFRPKRAEWSEEEADAVHPSEEDDPNQQLYYVVAIPRKCGGPPRPLIIKSNEANKSNLKEETFRRRTPRRKARSKSADGRRLGPQTLFSPAYTMVLSPETIRKRKLWSDVLRQDGILEEEYYKVPYEECNREIMLGHRLSSSETRLNILKGFQRILRDENKENIDLQQDSTLDIDNQFSFGEGATNNLRNLIADLITESDIRIDPSTSKDRSKIVKKKDAKVKSQPHWLANKENEDVMPSENIPFQYPANTQILTNANEHSSRLKSFDQPDLYDSSYAFDERNRAEKTLSQVNQETKTKKEYAIQPGGNQIEDQLRDRHYFSLVDQMNDQRERYSTEDRSNYPIYQQTVGQSFTDEKDKRKEYPLQIETHHYTSIDKANYQKNHFKPENKPNDQRQGSPSKDHLRDKFFSSILGDQMTSRESLTTPKHQLINKKYVVKSVDSQPEQNHSVTVKHQLREKFYNLADELENSKTSTSEHPLTDEKLKSMNQNIQLDQNYHPTVEIKHKEQSKDNLREQFFSSILGDHVTLNKTLTSPEPQRVDQKYSGRKEDKQVAGREISEHQPDVQYCPSNQVDKSTFWQQPFAYSPEDRTYGRADENMSSFRESRHDKLMAKASNSSDEGIVNLTFDSPSTSKDDINSEVVPPSPSSNDSRLGKTKHLDKKKVSFSAETEEMVYPSCTSDSDSSVFDESIFNVSSMVDHDSGAESIVDDQEVVIVKSFETPGPFNAELIYQVDDEIGQETETIEEKEKHANMRNLDNNRLTERNDDPLRIVQAKSVFTGTPYNAYLDQTPFDTPPSIKSHHVRSVDGKTFAKGNSSQRKQRYVNKNKFESSIPRHSNKEDSRSRFFQRVPCTADTSSMKMDGWNDANGNYVNIYLTKDKDFTQHEIYLQTYSRTSKPVVTVSRFKVPYSTIRDQLEWINPMLVRHRKTFEEMAKAYRKEKLGRLDSNPYRDTLKSVAVLSSSSSSREMTPSPMPPCNSPTFSASSSGCFSAPASPSPPPGKNKAPTVLPTQL